MSTLEITIACIPLSIDHCMVSLRTLKPVTCQVSSPLCDFRVRLPASPFTACFLKMTAPTKRLQVSQLVHRAAVIQRLDMVYLKPSRLPALRTSPPTVVKHLQPHLAPLATAWPLTRSPAHPTSPRDRTVAVFGLRARAPAASTRPWATSSRLVLLVPFFTSLVLPASSLFTIA